jgi:hypothetical protein
LYDCADAQDPDSILFSANGDACNYQPGGNIAGMLISRLEYLDFYYLSSFLNQLLGYVVVVLYHYLT